MSISVSPIGGALELALIDGSERKTVAEDLSGAVWLSRALLAFSVSPVYGKPGIFVLDCNTGSTRRILPPNTINSAYPDGADYFELLGASADGTQVYFFYGEDIDKIDFRKFRSRDFLFVVKSDGGAMRPSR